VSFKPEEFVCLSSIDSCSGYGEFAVEIRVASSVEMDLNDERLNRAAGDARDLVFQELAASASQRDPKAKASAAQEKSGILALFDEPVFVEEIPNGYCSSWCCRHLPWFIVTTRVGRFKIGWRKRVILIDWSDCPGTGLSIDLFANEDVTKGERMIHAWSYGKAREYIQAVVKSAQEAKIGE